MQLAGSPGHNLPFKFFLLSGHTSKRPCRRHTKCSSVRTIIAYADRRLESADSESSGYLELACFPNITVWTGGSVE